MTDILSIRVFPMIESNIVKLARTSLELLPFLLTLRTRLDETRRATPPRALSSTRISLRDMSVTFVLRFNDAIDFEGRLRRPRGKANAGRSPTARVLAASRGSRFSGRPRFRADQRDTKRDTHCSPSPIPSPFFPNRVEPRG